MLSADVTLRRRFQPPVRQPAAAAGQQTRTCYGDRSFLVNGPAVWNSLPVALRSPDTSLDIFKDRLKTFLLRTVYWMRICGLGEFARYKSPYYYYYYYYYTNNTDIISCTIVHDETNGDGWTFGCIATYNYTMYCHASPMSRRSTHISRLIELIQLLCDCRLTGPSSKLMEQSPTQHVNTKQSLSVHSRVTSRPKYSPFTTATVISVACFNVVTRPCRLTPVTLWRLMTCQLIYFLFSPAVVTTPRTKNMKPWSSQEWLEVLFFVGRKKALVYIRPNRIAMQWLRIFIVIINDITIITRHE